MKILGTIALATAMLFTCGVSMHALERNATAQPLPVDPAVKTGKLPNGLTYYVRHNGFPENRVNFYIAQCVGSLQEEEDQRGLAHFLEHMCFNGTKHFKDNDVIEYTRSLGVNFGGDLNAYTNIDRTVYNINNVPTTRGTAALDSCLLILRDWSHDITLDPTEIDKERGVIHEEWRLRTDAIQRITERNLETIYPGSKYGKRYPIGLMSVVDNFKHQALRDYYKKWYHPTNQAIIVVGDIDVDRTVEKIKEMFSTIPNPDNAAEVTLEPVPDNTEPIIVVDKDKEMQANFLDVMFKSESTPETEKAFLPYLLENYIKSLVCSMLNSRLQEEMLKPDVPYTSASVNNGNYMFSKTKDACSLWAVIKDDRTEEALKAIIHETMRAVKFGFTATEYERAKTNYLSTLENLYISRDKIDNDVFGRACVDNFLEKEPLMSIEQQYELIKQIAPMYPVEAVNEAIKRFISVNDTNVVILSRNIEKEGAVYPTVEGLKKAYEAARTEKVEAYVDNVKQEPLIATMPKAGKIVSEKGTDKFGCKELTLSNGARVILKKTDLDKGEVLFNASSKGGASLYGLHDKANTDVFNEVIANSGLGSFTSTELQKALAGKKASIFLSLNDFTENIQGTCTPKDMETMLQLNYLLFTAIKKDEPSYDNLINNLKIILKNRALSPDKAFDDSVKYAIHAHSPRFKTLEESDIDQINYDRILQIAKERTANAADFTFYIVGNFDEQLVRQYVEQYIASLPSIKNGKKYLKEDWKTISVYAKGENNNTFCRKQETPKSAICMVWYNNETPFSLDNAIKADAAAQILEMVYLKTIREEQSAAYAVSTNGTATLGGDLPYNALSGFCPVKPEKQDIATRIMREEFQKLSNTVDPVMLDKVKALMLKRYDDVQKTNGYWINAINCYDMYGVDQYTDYKKLVEALTPENVAKFVKDQFVGKNSVSVIMLPQE